MKTLAILCLFLASGLVAMAGIRQSVITATPTTNATQAVVWSGDGAGALQRVRLTVPSVGTNMTFALAENNGVAIISTNIAVAPTNGAFVISWTTNLNHGSYRALAGSAGWTNVVTAGVTNAAVPTITLDVLEDK